MIHVWIRATLDWNDEAAFRAQLDPCFAPKVERWNATFEMPYHLFRRELRRIAASSLADVEGVSVSEWHAIPEGALVVPIDDDDWLAPTLGRVLAQRMDSAVTGFRWIASHLEVPIDGGHALRLLRRRFDPGAGPRWSCSTNNYALRKSAETEDLLRRHTEASRWVERQPPGVVEHIPLALSLMNRSLASQTSLAFRRPSIGRAELVRKLRRYRALYRKPLRAELDWARPHVASMAELSDLLTVRSDGSA